MKEFKRLLLYFIVLYLGTLIIVHLMDVDIYRVDLNEKSFLLLGAFLGIACYQYVYPIIFRKDEKQ